MYVLLCTSPNGLLMFSCSLSFDCHLISRRDLRLLFCKLSEQIKERKFRNDLPWDWNKFKYDGNFKDYGHLENFGTREDLDRIEIWGNIFLSKWSGSLESRLSINKFDKPWDTCECLYCGGMKFSKLRFRLCHRQFLYGVFIWKRLIIEALWILNQSILKQNYRSRKFLKPREIPRCSSFALRYLCKTSYCTRRCCGNIIILCR